MEHEKLIRDIESLLILSILRNRKVYDYQPMSVSQIHNCLLRVMQESDEGMVKQAIDSLLSKGHLLETNGRFEPSMGLRFYYNEILEPGDEDLRTVHFIKRRMEQLENTVHIPPVRR